MKTKIITMLALILMSGNLYSQNITNTLGTNGFFHIKDASSNFFTLKQSNGYLGLGINPTQQLEITKNFKMPLTTDSGTGIIYKGDYRFIHNFKPANVPGRNTFMGTNSGNFTMHYMEDYSSSYNAGFGDSTLTNLTTGSCNTAIGTFALFDNQYGNMNTAVGYNSMRINNGPGNSALGSFSLYNNLGGQYNVALGYTSMYNNTNGHNNVALGNEAMYLNTTGYGNVAIGSHSLESNSTAGFNTAIGISSLYFNSTGQNNTAIGYYSGSTLQTGSNNIILGNNAQPTSGTVSNQITLGNNQITSLRCNVTSLTSLSDMRDKKNINELTLGLEFLNKLKPRQFNWDKREWYEDNRSDGSKTEEKLTAGFIAQELDEVQENEKAEWLGLVNKDNPDKIEATYGNLLPVMVKAIQELKEKNDLLEKNNNDLRDKLASIEKINEALVIMQKNQTELAGEINAMKKREENLNTNYKSTGFNK